MIAGTILAITDSSQCLSLRLSLSLYIYIYMCVYTCVFPFYPQLSIHYLTGKTRRVQKLDVVPLAKEDDVNQKVVSEIIGGGL